MSASQTRPRTFSLAIRKPLIAAVDGPTAGLGHFDALFFDLRFCLPDAKRPPQFELSGEPG